MAWDMGPGSAPDEGSWLRTQDTSAVRAAV